MKDSFPFDSLSFFKNKVTGCESTWSFNLVGLRAVNLASSTILIIPSY